MLVPIFVILLLIAINAFYVAAEFATVSVRNSRVRQLAEEGNSLARRLLPLIRDPHSVDRCIAACQVGITLSSLVVGAYGEDTLGRRLASGLQQWLHLEPLTAQSAAAVSILIVLTILQMVLGELVPKSVALRYPNQTAMYCALPLTWSLAIFGPFIAVLNGSGIAVLRLLGLPPASHRHIHSPDEIELLIAESRDGGLLEPDEHRRLHKALKLNVRPVRQLMVPRVHMEALEADTPVEEALQKLTASPYMRMPVYRQSIDQIVGVLYIRDLALRYVEGTFTSILEVMRPVVQVPAHITADRLLTQLREKHSHLAIVIDEYGGVEGLVTLEDILAEVLGEVNDEFKGDAPRPERLPDGWVRLPGQMRLDDAEPWIGQLWEGEADTVGGHIISVLGRLPAEGEDLIIDHVPIKIERMRQRAVASVLVRPVFSSTEVPHD